MSTTQKAAQQTPIGNAPQKFTYALKDYTTERRYNGWWISPTWSKSAGQKPEWVGPFATIETACLSIARRLAIELADRHTQSVERYGIERTSALYGLKPTTRLHQRRRPKETSSAL